jgi:hypothetical protein
VLRTTVFLACAAILVTLALSPRAQAWGCFRAGGFRAGGFYGGGFRAGGVRVGGVSGGGYHYGYGVAGYPTPYAFAGGGFVRRW